MVNLRKMSFFVLDEHPEVGGLRKASALLAAATLATSRSMAPADAWRFERSSNHDPVQHMSQVAVPTASSTALPVLAPVQVAFPTASSTTLEVFEESKQPGTVSTWSPPAKDILTVSELPRPSDDFQACRQNGPGSVCDPYGLINDSNMERINIKIATVFDAADSLYTKVMCEGRLSGIPIGAVIVKKINDIGNDKRIARKVYDHMGIGDSCGNGILVYLATESRKVYIVTGSNTFGIMRNDVVDRILETAIETRDATGDRRNWSVMLESIVDQIEIRVRAPQYGPENYIFPWNVPITVGVLTGFLYSDYISNERKKAEKNIEKYEATVNMIINDKKYDTPECPVCLEAFRGEAFRGRDPVKRKYLPCYHSACANCLSKIAETSDPPQCMMCRNPFSIDKLTEKVRPIKMSEKDKEAWEQSFLDYLTENVLITNRWAMDENNTRNIRIFSRRSRTIGSFVSPFAAQMAARPSAVRMSSAGKSSSGVMGGGGKSLGGGSRGRRC